MYIQKYFYKFKIESMSEKIIIAFAITAHKGVSFD